MQTIKKYNGLIIILLVALGIRWWNLHWGLPEVYEEAYPYHIAWKYWNWGSGGFNFNPHFYNYPAFTFILQFVVQVFHFLVGSITGSFSGLESFRQAYEADPSASIALARSVSVFFDLGTITFTYLLAKKLFNNNVALFSAAIIAINPLHISQVHLITVDPILTFFAVLSLYFVFHVYQSANLKWYIFSGIAIGLATASKYNGALLILVLIAAHFMRNASTKKQSTPLVHNNLLVSLVITVVTFFIINPFILFNFDEFYQGFSFEQYHVSSGHLGVDQSQSSFAFYFSDTFPSLLGIPLLLIVVLSLCMIFYKRDKEKILLALFPLIYLGVLLTWEMRVDRYALPIFPFFIMIGSVGISAIGNFASRLLTKSSDSIKAKNSQVALGINWSIFLLCCIPLVMATVKYQKSKSLPDTKTIVKQWINANLKPGTTIASVPIGIEYDKSTFIVIPIPYHPVLTEKTNAFYSYELYKDLDVVVASSFDYARYAVDSVKYGRFIKFYDLLKERSTLIYQIKPDENQNGPEISLYKPDTTRFDEIIDSTTINELRYSEDAKVASNFAGKLALTMSLKSRLIKSIQLYHLVVDIDPGNIIGRRELIKLLIKSEEYQYALEQIDQYLEHQPRDAEMFATKGDILFNLQFFDEAEAPLLQANQLDSNLESPYINLSIIYSYQDKKEKVIEIIEKYLKILPQGSEKYNLVRQRLDELMNMPD